MFYINTKLENNLLHSTFIIFVLLACLLEPDGISDGSSCGIDYFLSFHRLYSYVRYISFVTALYLMLKIGINGFSKMMMMIFLYHIVFIISSIINKNLTNEMLFVEAKILSLSIMADYYMQNVPLKFVKSLMFLLFIFVLLNLITLILFPNGMYTDNRWYSLNFFLGYKNRHIFYFLPCFLCFFLYEYINTGKYKFTFLLVSILLVSCLLNQSTTSLIVLALLALSVFFLLKIKFPNWLNANLVFWVGIGVSVVVIVMTINGSFDQYSEQLTEVFEKEQNTMGANSRGLIWIESVIYVIKHPIIGNGDISFNLGWVWDVTQAHNQYLDMAVIGGGVLVYVFLCQIFLLSKSMKKISNTEVFNCALFFLIVYSTEFLSEGKRNNYLWFPSLIIIYYIPNMITNSYQKHKMK